MIDRTTLMKLANDLAEVRQLVSNRTASEKQEKKLPGGWELKWDPKRPNSMYVEHEDWTDEAVKRDGKILYDSAERIPPAVQTAVKSFFKTVNKAPKTAGIVTYRD